MGGGEEREIRGGGLGLGLGQKGGDRESRDPDTGENGRAGIKSKADKGEGMLGMRTKRRAMPGSARRDTDKGIG